MWHKVSNDVATITMRARRWLAGKATEADFDPLMIATLELNHKTLETVGFPGEHCPLCFAQYSLGAKIPDLWITKCLDSIEIAARSSAILTQRGHRKVNGHDSAKIIQIK